MKNKLFTIEFIAFNIVFFFAFCNISIFYSFYIYLGNIDIPIQWRGFIVGLEPMTAFILRPIVSIFLHTGNSIKIMLISLFMIIISLISYQFAETIFRLIILRIFHGAAFVMLVSAVMSILVSFIPKEKSGQGFGFITATTLIPYAVMPLLTEFLLKYIKNEAQIYAWVSILAVPAVFLLIGIKKRINKILESNIEASKKSFSRNEIKENLKNNEILILLLINLLVFLSYSIVFFFIKNLSSHIGIKATGEFFTISTIVMIATRIITGKFLDKVNKLMTMKILMFFLSISLFSVGHITNNLFFILFSICYGFCIGMLLPLINASVFLVSLPVYRGLNSNLSLFMMDAAFFLTPYIGGIILSQGISVVFIFYLASLFMMLGILFLRIKGIRT